MKIDMDNLTFQMARHLAKSFPDTFTFRVKLAETNFKGEIKTELFWDLREMQYGEEVTVGKNYSFSEIRLSNEYCCMWLHMDGVKPFIFKEIK